MNTNTKRNLKATPTKGGFRQPKHIPTTQYKLIWNSKMQNTNTNTYNKYKNKNWHKPREVSGSPNIHTMPIDMKFKIQNYKIQTQKIHHQTPSRFWSEFSLIHSKTFHIHRCRLAQTANTYKTLIVKYIQNQNIRYSKYPSVSPRSATQWEVSSYLSAFAHTRCPYHTIPYHTIPYTMPIPYKYFLLSHSIYCHYLQQQLPSYLLGLMLLNI